MDILTQIQTIDVVAARLSIVGLLRRGCPPAIFLGIARIAIITFQHQAFRAAAHVLDKVRKAMSPSVANFNSASAILMVAFVFFVFAAGNHASPNIVFGPSVATSGSTMSEASASRTLQFSKNAAATFDARSQIASINFGCVATIAFAEPSGMPLSLIEGASGYDKSPKSLANDVDKVHYVADCSI